MEDRMAISRLKQADFDALEALVQRYQVPAVHAAYLIVRDRALAEDIAQNAFLKVMERIHQFDEERPFAPWFYRIVVNEALKIANTQRRIVALDGPSEERVAEIAVWLKDPSLLPERHVQQNEIREIILDAVGSLSPEQRAVIVMRYYLDMSEADMSARMDRPLSTIKWWLREARKRLRNLLSSSQLEEDG